MTSREIEGRLSDLRSALIRLDHSLELAAGEADDLASRGAVSRSEVAEPLGRARRSVQEALAIENLSKED